MVVLIEKNGHDLSALPEIEASHSEMVTLQNKTFISQKMVSLLEKNGHGLSTLPKIEPHKVQWLLCKIRHSSLKRRWSPYLKRMDMACQLYLKLSLTKCNGCFAK